MIAVVILATICVLLGRWQLGRLEERRAHNALVSANATAPARPVADVLAVDQPPRAQDEWSRVIVRGTYDARHQILVRYRQLDGEPGFNVLTPLLQSDRTAVLVNRGWIARSSAGGEPATPPPPPRGEVEVVGRVRLSEPADPGEGRPRDGQVRVIAVDQIAAILPYPVLDGYVELVTERPEGPNPDTQPRPVPAPELSEGPHLAYAIQWFIFAAIAIGGLGYLARDEAHGRRPSSRHRGPTGED
jgi:cytochrome oxidase assembly protein ShyY1